MGERISRNTTDDPDTLLFEALYDLEKAVGAFDVEKGWAALRRCHLRFQRLQATGLLVAVLIAVTVLIQLYPLLLSQRAATITRAGNLCPAGQPCVIPMWLPPGVQERKAITYADYHGGIVVFRYRWTDHQVTIVQWQEGPK